MTNLHDWFKTPLGRYLLEREQASVDRMVSDIFGFNAMQMGLPQVDFLRASRIPFRFTADAEGKVQLRSDPCNLPVASQSIDLLVLPHVLEFSVNPHQVLREVERVLIPEGRVIISGFNPWSLWGVWHMMNRSRGEYPWRGKFVPLLRLKDWLALLGFEVIAGHMCCYAPPVNSESWLYRFSFMESAGDRWWGMGGGAYFLQARKRVHSMRLIMPRWYERAGAEKGLAGVAQKAGEYRSHAQKVDD